VFKCFEVLIFGVDKTIMAEVGFYTYSLIKLMGMLVNKENKLG
jgi:hypothetical protein